MMEIPDIAQFARNFSVMVRIQGPDPKGLKMRKHAFHLHLSGNTTLSASGLLLPAGSLSDPPPFLEHIASMHHHSGALVITAASVVEPFLTAQHRDNPAQEFSPKLIPDARIDVLAEGKEGDEPGTRPHWLPSQLLALIDVSASSDALMSLVGAHSCSHEQASWEVSWSLAPSSSVPPPGKDVSQRQVGNDFRSLLESHRNLSSDELNNPTRMAKSATRIAFLGVSMVDLKDVLDIGISQPQRRGDFLLAMGSPFGILSPLHFHNSVSVGVVANCCPRGDSNHSSLLMADIHCLPGMEGCPVFDKHARLIGILTRPLRQKGGSAEMQLVITWDAIATVSSNELQMQAQRVLGEQNDRRIRRLERASLYSHNNFEGSVKCLPEGPDFPCPSPSLEKALSSIALVTVGDGAWASGIVLNNHGLVLTDAHVLGPWRFGRTSMLDKTTTLSVQHEISFSQKEENVVGEEEWILLPSRLATSNAFVAEHKASLLNLNHKSYKRISVRLDHMEQQVWYGASVVYVSEGPMDVALLQLESVPDHLCTITPELACPSLGSIVHVIGHGLFGPRSDVPPSISSGVLSSVVRIPLPAQLHESDIVGTPGRNMPVLLQTTAAVHPGASGGAVVNSHGHLIGLITSNARHGGGTLIPHMNFSIPCAALEAVFKYAEKQDISILHVLDKPNELVSSVWALVPPSSAFPQPPLGKNNREGKGSRFSQFLSEKHPEFTPSKDQERLKRRLLSRI